MTLCDAGPMVAIIDEDDSHHAISIKTLESLGSDSLVTTWPCLTEALHFAYRVGEHPAQDRIWEYVANKLIQITTPPQNAWRRVRELMAKYADTPMDLADASLVEAAERLNTRRVFTLDRHFFAYRIHGKDSFDIVPASSAH